MPLFGSPNIAQLEARRDAQGLIKALAFKDPAIRKAAADALAPLKDPDAVGPLAALLDDGTADVRRAAVAALAARGGFRVVEPLVRALGDGDAEVRAVAATAVYKHLMSDPDVEARRSTAAALGRIRAADGVEPLIQATRDADETVRVAAARALQAIGDARAVLPLVLLVAREAARSRSTGPSSVAVERAASAALDALCDNRAVDPLGSALSHRDPDVREIAVRRLARIGSPEAAARLAASLADGDPVIRRASARSLAEIGWRPPADETGARYWAALREWRRCAECGPAAVPILVSSFDSVDAAQQDEILAALAQLDWEPEEAGAAAVSYWASRGRWDKCVEAGPAAVGALDTILRRAPRWRDRVEAATALAALGETRNAPFSRLDLVRRALAILDGESDDADRRGLLEGLLLEERPVDPASESVEFCRCGYPATKASQGGSPRPIPELLGVERSSNGAATYYCPSCDTRQAGPAD